MNFIVALYEWMHTHRWLRRLILVVLTVGLVVSMTHLTYKEDISAFFPMELQGREDLNVYQSISGADRIVVLFENKENDEAISAVDDFCSQLQKKDSAGWVSSLVYEVNMQQIADVTEFTYSHIPYFLTETDYRRIDSCLASPTYLEEKLEENYEMLMFPGSSMLASNLSSDPLNLFTPTVTQLQSFNQHSKMESRDGYIFTPDMKYALVALSSPFGNSETEMNALLVSLVEEVADSVSHSHGEMRVKIIGGPKIAVGNSSQIKTDSIIAISLSVVLIIALLLFYFRSVSHIVLILLSIAWGWLFALGFMALARDNVSIIVIGISSIILGIAVNYPLHLLAHAQHQPDRRLLLREIMMPLIVGNVTTVGAFAALIPLQSIALRDLGIFAALLLFGSILFVLVFLPHLIRRQKHGHVGDFGRMASFKLEGRKGVVWAVVVLTIVLSVFSLQTGFDTNMANINYMSDETRQDMEYLSQMFSTDTVQDRKETVYVVSSAKTFDEALQKNESLTAITDSLIRCKTIAPTALLSKFLPSKQEQQRRLKLWNSFVNKHKSQLLASLREQAPQQGFAVDAFSNFGEILNASYEPLTFENFAPLTETVLATRLCQDHQFGTCNVVEKFEVDPLRVEQVERAFPRAFDVVSMNQALVNNLSDNFNYIGIVCSLIVFLFLWLSLGHIELALISFVPMAVSWLWILGLMGLMGMKFNIVNIILATFIFGQGDDYTIFMTEGCSYEFARRKSMLTSLKNSIILSGLIMFAGIGTLIFAKHPALRSLAEVTIIGMFSVVFMAYLFPPLLFNWMVRRGKHHYRLRPIKLINLLRIGLCAFVWFSQLAVGYVIGFVLFVLFRPTPRTKLLFHRIVSGVHRLDIKILPSVKHDFSWNYEDEFKKPCVIACNHQSMLDPMYLMALSPRILIVANRRASFNPIIRVMFRWLDFYTITDDTFVQDIDKFRSFIQQGYSVAIFPEGERNKDSSILRFHKGVFYLAKQLEVDVLPIMLHGINYVMPIHSFVYHPGNVTIRIGERIGPNSPLWGKDHAELTRNVHQLYLQRYEEMVKQLETASFFVDLVKDRYRYKGIEIYRAVANNLKRNKAYTAVVDKDYSEGTTLVVKETGYGELALLLALVHPNLHIVAYEADEDKFLIAKYAAKGAAGNLTVILGEAQSAPTDNKIIINPS